MPEIKTREVVQGTIKTLDRSAVIGERMKKAYIKTKDKAEHSVYSSESSPEEYASDRIGDSASTVIQEAGYQADRQVQRFIRGREEKGAAPNQEYRQNQTQHRRESKDQSRQSAGKNPPSQQRTGSQRYPSQTNSTSAETPQSGNIPRPIRSDPSPAPSIPRQTASRSGASLPITRTTEHPHQRIAGGDWISVREDMPVRRGTSAYHSKAPNPKAVRERQVAAAKKAFQKKRQEQAMVRSHAHGTAGIPMESGSVLVYGDAPDTHIPREKPLSAPIRPKGKAAHSTARNIKTVERTTGTIRQKAAPTAKSAVKGADRTIKTAEHTVKTAERVNALAAKSAQRSAKAAAVATQKAVAAAKAAAVAAKAAAAATVKVVKAIIAATERLISALIAGGSVALIAVIVILMIGMIAGSAFGIFFNSEMEDSRIQDVVREINTAYEQRLDAIEGANPHDEVEMYGSRASWSEILAVYAVRATTDPDNPLDVVTMDEERKEILEEVFWDMNEIDFETETRTETEMQEIEDENGELVETPVDVDKVYLMITISHKTPEEMADLYGFDENQREQLEQLLDEEFASMWLSVLYGIRVGESDIVAVALSQLGNVGGEPYWSWYGFPSREEWCACFVSWCAEQCGYIEAGVIPKFAGCDWGVYFFRSRGLWADGAATPVPGMIIFFDWDNKGRSGPQDGTSDHVGIVERVEDGIVYTIEGNSGDACRQRSYSIGHFEILGYGMPEY